MQNRYNSHVPELYVDLPPLRYGTQSIPDKPVPLDVFDVTYVHYHRYLELGFCLHGTGRSIVEDKIETFRQGDIVIIYPFQRHISCNSTREFSLWNWAYIDLVSLFSQSGIGNIAKLNEILQTEMGLCGILDQNKYPELAQQARKLLAGTQKDTHQRHGQERFALEVYDFILMLSDASVDLPKLQMHTDQKLALIKPALDAINASLDKELIPSVEELSVACCMSESYFRRIFHNVAGVSPKDYITMTCIRKATLLLSLTDLKVMEIAMHCGYQEISCFNRCFLKSTGMTPSEYRRKYRGAEVPASTGGVLSSGLRAYGD